MKNKTVDLFIKTYSADFRWLKYCLKSVIKFATNYNELIIIVPANEMKEFYEANFELPERTQVIFIQEEGRGYMFQQYIKMTAHHYSKADYIKYLDSDCILNKPFDAYSLIYDGKPEILYRPYLDDFGKNQVDGAVCWQLPTSRFVGKRVTLEFMCRHIFCYHRSTLENIEKFIQGTTGIDLKEYILSSESFSEFNAIGAYCFYNESEKYSFNNTTKGWTYVDPQVEQIWSYAQKGGDEGHKKEYTRGLEIINKIFDLQLTEI